MLAPNSLYCLIVVEEYVELLITCVCLESIGITGVSHHTQPKTIEFMVVWSEKYYFSR